MRELLVVLGVAAGLAAAFSFVEAQSVMHQIFAGTMVVAAAVFLVGASVVSAIQALPRRTKEFELQQARMVSEMQMAATARAPERA